MDDFIDESRDPNALHFEEQGLTWIPSPQGAGGRWGEPQIEAVYASLTPAEPRELLRELEAR